MIKWLSLLLSIVLLMQTESTIHAQENPVKAKTVIDQNGMTVTIPKRIDSVVTLALPLPSAYALTGKPARLVVGMHPGSKSAIESSIMSVMYPDLLKAETSFVEGDNINIEELMKLKPDIAFYWGDFLNQGEALKKAGIPAIAVKTQGDGDAILTFETWMNILGQVFDAQTQTEKVVGHARTVQGQIEEKVRAIPDDQKVTTLILHRNTDNEIIVHGGNMYGRFWIETTGGICVTRDLKGTANITMEEIYAWDPDIIIISSFSPAMPDDLYSNKFSGQNWSELKAIKNRRVYKEPVGVYRWYPPSGDVPLMLKWMATVQYPELFSYEMTEEIIAYYKEFYNFELSIDQAAKILNTSTEASVGTKF